MRPFQRPVRGTILAACSILLLGVPVHGPATAGDRLVRVATLSDFPPHCFTREPDAMMTVETVPPGEDSSQLRGFAWDVVRESFHASDYSIQLYVVPWSRGMHYVETGKADVIFPAMKTEEREKKFLFSEEPVIRSSFIVYVPKSTRIGWAGLESLNGKRVVGVKGWAFGKEWEANDEIVKMEAYSILQGFEMVRKGWVFGMAGYDVPFDYVLRQEGLADRFKKLPSWGSTAEFVLGAKAEKHIPKLLHAFDLGKRKIERNGTLEAIKAKWQ